MKHSVVGVAGVDFGNWGLNLPLPDPRLRVPGPDTKPLSLEQVLRAGFSSFDSGSDQGRYVAQSYTLTHFLVSAAEGKSAYAEFQKSSYLGKGGSSNFFRVLELERQGGRGGVERIREGASGRLSEVPTRRLSPGRAD